MNHFASLATRFPGMTSILRNGAMLTGTQWAEAGLRGAYALLIGRWLGPELYGAWSFATTTYAFVIAFTMFGLDMLTPLRLGRDRGASAFLGTTLILRLGLVCLAAAALAVYALAVESDATVRLALLIVLPALIGRGLVLWSRSVFQGLERNRTAFGLAVALRACEVSAGLTSLALGAGLPTLLAIHAIAWLAEAALSFPKISRHVSVPLRIDRVELKRILADGFVVGLSTAGLATLTAAPLILTRHLTDDLQTVGQMGLAMQIAALAVMGAQGLLAAALPVVSRASAKGDPRLRLYPGLVALGAIMVFGPAIMGAAYFGPVVVPILMGENFTPAGVLLAPALLVGGLMVLPVGVWQLLVTERRSWSGAAASWSGVGALVLILPPMTNADGATGALTATVVAWTLRAAILIGWAFATRTARKR